MLRPYKNGWNGRKGVIYNAFLFSSLRGARSCEAMSSGRSKLEKQSFASPYASRKRKIVIHILVPTVGACPERAAGACPERSEWAATRDTFVFARVKASIIARITFYKSKIINHQSKIINSFCFYVSCPIP